MATNLLNEAWANLDSFELRLLLDERIGGPGQYSGRTGPLAYRNTLYLPLAGDSCRIVLTFRDKNIIVIKPGPAFDNGQWQEICEQIENTILSGPPKVGREYSFSSFRVQGSWRGKHSGIQILPPPDDAPSAGVEMAEHPFILEFPMQATNLWRITNHRRIRDHRNLTRLLNVLLAGGTSLQPLRWDHFWALVPRDGDEFHVEWVQLFFYAKLGQVVVDQLSPPANQTLEEIEPEEYYTCVGHDGKGLRVPVNLDQSICHYLQLSQTNRVKFDRASFWMEMASRLWNTSVSLTFASLVSAIESMNNGRKDRKKKFIEFFEKYASDTALRCRRDDMYDLRSSILHGSQLIQLDQDLAFGWDPPWQNEHELIDQLSRLARIALRNEHVP